MLNWYALNTKPRSEKFVFEGLAARVRSLSPSNPAPATRSPRGGGTPLFSVIPFRPSGPRRHRPLSFAVLAWGAPTRFLRRSTGVCAASGDRPNPCPVERLEHVYRRVRTIADAWRSRCDYRRASHRLGRKLRSAPQWHWEFSAWSLAGSESFEFHCCLSRRMRTAK